MQFTYVPTYARQPQPATGTVDVLPDVVLSWRAGREAAVHKVYFGTDVNNLSPATAVSENRYTVPSNVLIGEKYYWKVDEVNEVVVPNVWRGDVWSLSIVPHTVVDDFESYTDSEGSWIFEAWIDGATDGKSGSFVGYNPTAVQLAAGAHFAETTVVHGGKQSMPLEYNNVKTPYYSEAQRSWSTAQDWTRWGATHLTMWYFGRPKWEGSISYDATTQKYTMTGTGFDIWTNTGPRFDEFHYAFKQLTGDGSITAKIDSCTMPLDWTRVGVMMRNSLDGNAVNALAYVTPAGRVGWQWRLVTGSTCDSTRSENAAVTLPHWVRLTRQGDTITAKHSRDGITWEDMVEPANPQEPTFRTIPMNQTIYVGLVVCSHVDHVIATAVLSSVSTTGNVTPAGPFATSQDVGLPAGNDPGRLYVAVEDAKGHRAVVADPNGPSAVQSREWRPFRIPLANVASQGVDAAQITKMSIGVGDASAKVSGGKGLLLIDDIWLERSK